MSYQLLIMGKAYCKSSKKGLCFPREDLLAVIYIGLALTESDAHLGLYDPSFQYSKDNINEIVANFVQNQILLSKELDGILKTSEASVKLEYKIDEIWLSGII